MRWNVKCMPAFLFLHVLLVFEVDEIGVEPPAGAIGAVEDQDAGAGILLQKTPGGVAEC
jgi:hypothetical protein